MAEYFACRVRSYPIVLTPGDTLTLHIDDGHRVSVHATELVTLYDGLEMFEYVVERWHAIKGNSVDLVVGRVET